MESILVIDVGTSSMRGILYSFSGEKLSAEQVRYSPSHFPDGTVEQDPQDYCQALVTICRSIAEKSIQEKRKIEAIAVTSQRSSVIPLNEAGDPLFPTIMWQDTRNKETADRLSAHNRQIQSLTGSRVNCVFSGSKMSWFLEAYPGLAPKVRRFVNIPEYLIHQMTGQYKSDYTYGSRSNLMNLKTCDWDDSLLQLFGVRRDQLCPLQEPGSVCGGVRKAFADLTGITAGTPVITAGGDQQCAAVGHGAYQEGIVSVTTGTGGFLITTCDLLPEKMTDDLICNCAAVPGKYVLEGNVLTCCSAFDWFCSSFYDWETPDYGAIDQALIRKYGQKSECMVLPFFQGRSAPDWNASARATFHGVSLATDREDMLKALLEGIFIEIDNGIDRFRKYVTIRNVSISGGLTNSRIMNQMQADVYGVSLMQMTDTESTSNGAFMVAANSLQICDSFDAAFELICRSTKRMEYIADSRIHQAYEEQRIRSNALYDRIYAEKPHGKEKENEVSKAV